MAKGTTTKKESAPRYFGRQWRAAYGLTLKRDEMRLVQGFRGLQPAMQQRLLMFVSGLVVERASEGRIPCRPFEFDPPKQADAVTSTP